MNEIMSSGLLDGLHELHIVLVGDKENHPLQIPNDLKIIVHFGGYDTLTYERPTLTLLHQYTQQHSDTYILYVHNKGASYPLERLEIASWVDYLVFFYYY